LDGRQPSHRNPYFDSGSYLNALESARKLGCNALQVFSASPRMWAQGSRAFRTPMHPRFAHGARTYCSAARYSRKLPDQSGCVAAHAPNALDSGVHDELVRGIALGADFLVVHPGARGENSSQHAVGTIIEGVKQAAKRVPLGNLRILIENTAGMGTAVGSSLVRNVPTSSRDSHR